MIKTKKWFGGDGIETLEEILEGFSASAVAGVLQLGDWFETAGIDESVRDEVPTDARDTVTRLGPSGHFESEFFKREYGADYQGKLSKDFRGYRFDHLERIDKDGRRPVPFSDGPWEEIPEVE